MKTLDFLEEIFDINQKFTKYVFIEEIVVFYVRTHHTNFVRLYNKFKKYHSKGRTQKLKSSLTLCKAHLKCLYAIARNRSEDTRQKLFQFQVVPFLAKELSLEHEYIQARKVFLGVSKKAAKEANEMDYEYEEIASPEKPKKKYLEPAAPEHERGYIFDKAEMMDDK